MATGLRPISEREREAIGEFAARHGRVVGLDQAIADSDGGIGMPLLRLDALARLQARGRISPGMRAAGETFAAIFRRAQLDELRAVDPGRVRTGRVHLLDDATASAERCRRRIAEIVAYLGGSTSPAASIIWAVCGEHRTVRQWSLTHGRDAGLACGVLVGGLSALAGYFASGRARPARSLLATSLLQNRIAASGSGRY